MALLKQSLGSANSASKNNTETVVFAKRVSESIQHVSNGLSTSHAGALIQVWMPETYPDGRILLQTEGLPFAISGVGDLLALFRCISCKYHFESDPKASESMGAIGRVYYSGTPELCLDIPQYDKTTYLRIKEAQLCRIHSTLIMPVFKSEELGRSAIAVVEISHDDKAVEFNNVFQLFKDSLKMVNLYTADSGLNDWNLGLRQWPMEAFSSPLTGLQQSENYYPLEQEISRKHSLAKALQTGLGDVSDLLMTVGMDSLTAGGLDWGLEVPEECSDSPNEVEKVPRVNPLVRSLSDRGSSNDTALISGTSHEEETQHGGCKAQCATAAQILAQGGFQESEPNPEFTANEDIIMKDETEEDGDQSTGVIDQANCDQQGKKNENRLAGGAGRRLSYQDLERHFSFGLKDAANRLGICPTTLKRACRRNGINRWPSRQISKLSKVWKQMGYGGKPPAWLLQNAISGNLRSDNLAYILNTGLHVGGHLPSQNSLSTTTTTSTAPFQGLDQTQNNDFKNRTHHGAYTAALQGGNESLVFEDNSVTTNHCNHTWHGGDILDATLHSSVFPAQPLNPYLTTTTASSLGFSNEHVNLNGLSSEGRIAGHDSMSNVVSYDLEKTQRSGMALVLSELAIMEQDDDLLQHQLNGGPLAFENTRHLF